MGITAQRAYDSSRTGHRTESAEDREYRLSRTYNNILHSIEKVSDAKAYLQVRNAINAYSCEAGKGSVDVIRMTQKLNKRVKELESELNEKIRTLNTEIEEIKNDRFEESPEQLQELNAQVDYRTLQMLMKLKGNNDGGSGDRRRIGNFVAQADRSQAIALMRIAAMPQFSNLFSAKQKEVLVEKSKSEAEVIYERNKAPLLAEKGAELGKMYLKSMNLRNAFKKIGNQENAHYFVDNVEEG